MIITEQYNATLQRRYSNNSMMLRQVETGAEYAEAIDIMPCPYTYEETQTPIQVQEEEMNPDTYSEMHTIIGILTGDEI